MLLPPWRIRGRCVSLLLALVLLTTRCGAAALTSMKYYGPSHADLNVTALEISMDAGCSRSHPGSGEGTLTVFDLYMQKCSLPILYLKLVHAGTSGILRSVPIDPPGLFVYSHDFYLREETSDQSLPLFEFNRAIGSFFESRTIPETPKIYCGYTCNHLTPSVNEWEAMFNGFPWIFAVRIFFGSFAMKTSFIALQNFRARSTYTRRSCDAVLASEAFFGFVLSIYIFTGPVGSSEFTPYQIIAYCCTGLSGTGLFTSLTLALHWRSLIRSLSISPAPPSRAETKRSCSGRVGLLGLFVVSAGFDISLAALFVGNFDNRIEGLMLGLLMFAQALSAIFFISISHRVKYELFGAIRQFGFNRGLAGGSAAARAQVRGSASPSIPQPANELSEDMRRMSLLLSLSGCFMLLHIGGLLCIALFSFTPTGLFVTTVIFLVGRLGTSYTQVLSVHPPSVSRSISNSGRTTCGAPSPPLLFGT